MTGEEKRIKNKNGCVIWLTGLPCSGKSVIASHVKSVLDDLDLETEWLDGDIIREYVKNQDFSTQGRSRHLHYVAMMSKLLADHGTIVICSFVSPYSALRKKFKSMIPEFYEVYVKCPLYECMNRDNKGMYADAKAGKIANFTGVNDTYEEPTNPDLVVETDKDNIDECTFKVIKMLKKYRDDINEN